MPDTITDTDALTADAIRSLPLHSIVLDRGDVAWQVVRSGGHRPRALASACGSTTIDTTGSDRLDDYVRELGPFRLIWVGPIPGQVNG